MISLPASSQLKIDKLSSIFNDTTNSYKFYWFLAILDIVKDTTSNEIEIQSIYKEMFNQVWYPLNFFKLSFGINDSFKTIENLITDKENSFEIDNRYNSPPILEQIKNKLDDKSLKIINNKIQSIARYVPYRFLRPFFENMKTYKDSDVNRKIIASANKKSKTNPFDCPYFFIENKVVINYCWFHYFKKNYLILKSYTSFYLIKFLQKNNPSVIGICDKLEKPTKRNLFKYKVCWDYFLNKNKYWKCIYSKEYIPANFSLDHYIPWSYNTTDVVWNLIPTLKNVNSSKSNCLPANRYIEDFTNAQFDLFHLLYNDDEEKFNTILQEYALLFRISIEDINLLDKRKFTSRLHEEIEPMLQTAKHLGHINNWVYKK